jgi:putative tricarboxylic transport membrane protein
MDGASPAAVKNAAEAGGDTPPDGRTEMSTGDSQAARSRLALPEFLIGIGLLACAGGVLWQTLAIPVSPMYSKVGPTVFPYMTMAGLAVLAVFLLVAAWRGGWQPDDEKDTPADWKAMAFVVAGLLANVALIQPLGFTFASVVMFVLVTFGFGSRNPLRDGLLGLILALAAYFGFARALGVNIGAGVIENVLNSGIDSIIGGLGS